jgi:hypothetical protein
MAFADLTLNRDFAFLLDARAAAIVDLRRSRGLSDANNLPSKPARRSVPDESTHAWMNGESAGGGCVFFAAASSGEPGYGVSKGVDVR